jgi:ABC-2 type transport system ATP-binding protein
MTSTPEPSSWDLAITAEDLGKRFGDLWALRHLDLAVPTGSVLGLLGPNGAGKTTTVRILTTLLTPDEGTASVAGLDVVRGAADVRRRIGLAGQQATVDELLSGRGNLEMLGRLHHFPRAKARARAAELLETFELADAADRLTKTYSGGMRRRLDLAASLVATPPVLFLDEPTTGLDPHSRNELWGILRELVAEGTTLLLTTQYLEEADQLCDQVVVVDHGGAVASGSPQQLKQRVGGAHLDVVLAGDSDLVQAAALLAELGRDEPVIDHQQRIVSVAIDPSVKVPAVVRALDAAGVDVDDVVRRSSTLDDVFLTLTGAPAVERDPEEVSV